MNCIIVEDQPPAQRILKKYIADIGSLELKATFTDPIQAMAFLQTEPIDLMFLDVHLPKLSGIEFLKALTHPPQVILTTAFAEYALEGYELNLVDYLLKPFSFQRFVSAVAKVPVKSAPVPLVASETEASSVERKSLFLKSGHELIKVWLEDIIYIKSDADYTEVVLAKKKYLSSESLRYWEAELDAKQFIRVHKSYIINSEKIEKVTGSRLYLGKELVVPIGRTYKEDFMERIR